MSLVSSITTPMIIVASTNLIYLGIAFWLWKTKRKNANLFLAVAIVSTYFHLDPSSRVAYSADVITASITLLWSLLNYLDRNNNVLLLTGSAASSILAWLLFLKSGSDRDSWYYVMSHGMWHILTGIAFVLLALSYSYGSQQRVLISIYDPARMVTPILLLPQVIFFSPSQKIQVVLSAPVQSFVFVVDSSLLVTVKDENHALIHADIEVLSIQKIQYTMSSPGTTFYILMSDVISSLSYGYS